MAAKTTPTERAALDTAVARVRVMLQRARTDLVALPVKASRTPAQQRAARDARDTILLARTLLLLAGRQTADDLDDGPGQE